MGQPGENTDWAGGGRDPSAKDQPQDRCTGQFSNPTLPPLSLPGLPLSEDRGCERYMAWNKVQVPSATTSCGTLGKSLILSGPQFALQKWEEAFQNIGQVR